MRMPRLTILNLMTILAILALVGSIPIRYESRRAEADRRHLALRAETSSVWLSKLADDPAVWLDEFRPELRRLAGRYRDEARSIEQTGMTPPIQAGNSPEDHLFLKRLRLAARENLYRLNEPGPRPISVRTLGGDLDLIWPLLVALALLRSPRPIRERLRVLRSGPRPAGSMGG